MERVFVGIRLGPLAEAVAALREAQGLEGKALATAGRSVRWISDNNLHMTLRFIGDITLEDVERLKAKLASLHSPKFSVSFKNVGVIPKRGPPRVLYLHGIEPTGYLVELQRALEASIQELGYQPEEKKFLPHVTVARLNRVSPQQAKMWTEQNQAFALEGIPIDEFILFRSKLLPTGAAYEEIQAYPLDENL